MYVFISAHCKNTDNGTVLAICKVTLREKEKKMRVENYNLKANNGKHARVATKAILNNGQEILFTEKMSKKEAIRNAQYQIKKGL